MQKYDEVLIKGLVHMMWADGVIEDYEREFIGKIMADMGCSTEEIIEISKMMRVPPTEDLDIKNELPDMAKREEFLQTLLGMAMVDGVLAKSEKELVDKVAAHLEITPARVADMMNTARDEVKSKRDLREE